MTMHLQQHEMTIGEICDRRLPVVPVSTTVIAAAKSMQGFGERLLVITAVRDGKLRARGVVTDRELAAIIAREGNPRELTVGDIMRPNPGFVTEDDGILETAIWMRQNGLRDVIVHDRQGALLGVVGLDRLIESLAAELVGVVHSESGAAVISHDTALH